MLPLFITGGFFNIEYLCSHSIGLLIIILILQQKVATQEEFEENYRISPLMVQGCIILIENVMVLDRFRMQCSQRRRRSRERLSEAERRQSVEDNDID